MGGGEKCLDGLLLNKSSTAQLFKQGYQYHTLIDFFQFLSPTPFTGSRFQCWIKISLTSRPTGTTIFR